MMMLGPYFSLARAAVESVFEFCLQSRITWWIITISATGFGLPVLSKPR
jgi:hypothetical protein